MKNITRDEIKDAMQRYIADGGKIEKIKFKDNGMLLNNDLMSVSYTHLTLPTICSV